MPHPLRGLGDVSSVRCQGSCGGMGIVEDYFNKRYVVAGGNSIFRGRGGYTWEEEEYYCLEHWARWLRWGLASQVDCEQWVEWADGVLDALVASWREKIAEKNTMCR